MTQWQLYLLFSMLFQILARTGPKPSEDTTSNVVARILLHIISLILGGFFGWALATEVLLK